MKTKLMAIGMAIAGFLSVAHSQTLVTNLSAYNLWTDTGIVLTNNEWVNINGSGFWYWDDISPSTYNDPDGTIDPGDNGDTWVQNGVHGSIVAFVGADPYIGTIVEGGTFQTNQYLEIGTADQFMTPTNGELWLGINDDLGGGYGDNGD